MKLWQKFVISCFLGAYCLHVGAESQTPEAIRKAHGVRLAPLYESIKKLSAKPSENTKSQSPSAAKGISGLALCGNSVLDAGEQCDDGNPDSGDGCSSSCQVESGWECTDPIPADISNLVMDPGFEAGPMGGVWAESSTNFETLICNSDCGLSGQRSGNFWAWFGGIDASPEEGEMSQSFTIPETATELRFWIAAPSCGANDDFIEVLLDENSVWMMLGSDPACNDATYMEQVVDISAWADGAVHELAFHSIVSTPPNEFTDFFLDDILLIHGPANPVPSTCSNTQPEFIFAHGFESGL